MPNAEIITVRNLVESEFGTPLRKFYGVLDSYYPDEGKFGTRVVLNFKELKVIETVEPYNFPTAVISIKLSNRKRSAWGIFGESLVKLLSENQDIKDCQGMRIGMVMTPNHDYGENRQTGEKIIGSAWEVFEVAGKVAGAAETSALDEAKKLLDGKTRAEFNRTAYANPIIRQDVNFQRAVTDKSFINSMVQLGEFTEDENGIFHSTRLNPQE